MEHRWGQRQPVNRPVHIRTQGGLAGRGCVRDLSVSGAFIATSLPVAQFSCVEIQFRQKDGFATVTCLEGEVVRTANDGFGIEWRQFGANEVLALARHNCERVDQRDDLDNENATFRQAM
jgi:hypothetical protein